MGQVLLWIYIYNRATEHAAHNCIIYYALKMTGRQLVSNRAYEIEDATIPAITLYTLYMTGPRS